MFVANVVGEAVARAKVLPILRIVHILEVSEESVSANCGLVDEDTVKAHAGVDVPIPNPTLLPPFGLSERNADVEVANLLLPPLPLPLPQAEPVEETRPFVDCRHPVPVERKSCDVEAIVAKKFVVVALLVVLLRAVKF